MYLLFNTPLNFVIAFLPRSNCLLISCLQSPRRGNLSLFHLSPFYLPGSNAAKCHDLSFLMFCFKLGFSLSSFTFIKRFFSSSLLSAIRVVYSKSLLFICVMYHTFYLLIPFIPSPLSFPFDNFKLVFYACESVSVL